MPSYIGFDTETYLIAPQQIAPKLVCGSFYDGIDGTVLGNHPADELRGMIRAMLQDASDNGNVIIIHNAAFDLAVICADNPDLFPLVFELLERGLISDTIIREKLLNLTTTGDLQFRKTPDGGNSRLLYGLDSLEKFYLGRDRSEQKHAEDAWRLNYNLLDGKPAAEYPQEAYDYALLDADGAYGVFFQQEARRQKIVNERGFDPFKTEWLHVAADFCLFLMTCRGVRIDPVALAKVEAIYTAELADDKLPHLIAEGILRPATPPRPHARGAKNPDGTPKMTKGTKASINETKLTAYIETFAAKHDIVLSRTEPSDNFPDGKVSLKAEFFNDHKDSGDPVIAEYHHREKLQKIVNTEIPRMRWYTSEESRKLKIRDAAAAVVHPAFDVLKEAARTSSYAPKDAPYPAFNCQNVDPRARCCYIPRDGFLMSSNDLSGMELGTGAQTCLNLFGFSVAADKINANVDLHAYLGSGIAYKFNADFRNYVDSMRPTYPDLSQTELQSKLFLELKKSEFEDVRTIFKKYRKLAKPTGLGYPGGLGPKTFVGYAKNAPYNEVVTIEEATEFRDIWREQYPEYPMLFQHISKNCIDPYNKGRRKAKNKTTGEEYDEDYDLYQYTTPLGMVRAGCDYCAACNGIALQSPSAEGTKIGLFLVTRACYDPTQQSILYGSYFPLMFIHDEIVGENKDDEGASDRCKEVGRLMVEGMKVVTPDVAARYEATLMRVWNKFAEPVLDAAGNITVWTPKEAS